MTANQVQALRALEERRHNAEQERLSKALIPAQYLSSIGSLVRGASGFFKPQSIRSGSNQIQRAVSRHGRKYVSTYPKPLEWTIQ